MIKDDLLKKLPNRYQEEWLMNAILDADSVMLEKLFENISDLAKQRFVVTATWGLYEWEKFVAVDILQNENLSIEQRRARVLAKLMSINTVTHFRINEIVKRFIESAYVIELISNCAIKVVIGESEKVIKAMYETIEEIKPAHLGLVVEFIIDNSLYLGLFNCEKTGSKVLCKRLYGEESTKLNSPFIGFFNREKTRSTALCKRLYGEENTTLNNPLTGYALLEKTRTTIINNLTLKPDMLCMNIGTMNVEHISIKILNIGGETHV